jgi:hypothetical protein
VARLDVFGWLAECVVPGAAGPVRLLAWWVARRWLTATVVVATQRQEA